mmetsp:Transcript_105714/g.303815  ORF Transcript_105714/g.303815 Transcript_105714/m.303815 type:complete len:200 (-) Transcript_105714:171-770(-)
MLRGRPKRRPSRRRSRPRPRRPREYRRRQRRRRRPRPPVRRKIRTTTKKTPAMMKTRTRPAGPMTTGTITPLPRRRRRSRRLPRPSLSLLPDRPSRAPTRSRRRRPRTTPKTGRPPLTRRAPMAVRLPGVSSARPLAGQRRQVPRAELWARPPCRTSGPRTLRPASWRCFDLDHWAPRCPPPWPTSSPRTTSRAGTRER